MNFPNEDLIRPLSTFLNENFGNNYFIWNVSEHSYDYFPFGHQVIKYFSLNN